MRTGLRHTNYKSIKAYVPSETACNENLLKVENLIFRKSAKTILHIDNLKFHYGNIIGIIGENGIGKSTFAKIVCGLYRESKGEFFKKNKRFSSRSRLKESLLIMQEVNCQLFTDSVYDELLLTSKTKDKNVIDDWIDDMDLKIISERNPHTLSGGQKQRVIILSALLSDKEILFFDEPTSGLDYRNMMIVAKNIKKVKEENRLILIISHDIEFLESCCDTVINL